MSEYIQQPTKQLNFCLLLLISFALFNIAYIVDQTFRWSDHLQGFMNGVVHIMLFGIVWSFYILPWTLLVFALYHWRKWKRFRTHWVLAPAVLALVVSIGSLIFDPPTPPNRFKKFAKANFPKNTENLYFHFSGGGLADYHDKYYFQTSPAEVDRLISELRLTEGGGYLNAAEINYASFSNVTGFPSEEGWQNSKVFARNNDETGWHYELRVDSSKTKVFIVIGCI